MTATIEAHGLKKRYGKTMALDGLDLIAQPGQVTAVLGPNGAGKTTFVRTVATLQRADEGILRVAGHDARKDPAAVRGVGRFAAAGGHGHQHHHRDDDEQQRQHPPRLGEDVEPVGEEEHAGNREDGAGHQGDRIRGVALHHGACGGVSTAPGLPAG